MQLRMHYGFCKQYGEYVQSNIGRNVLRSDRAALRGIVTSMMMMMKVQTKSCTFQKPHRLHPITPISELFYRKRDTLHFNSPRL